MIDGTLRDVKRCVVCDTEYAHLKYCKDENPHFCTWTNVVCPRCGFNPNIENIIEKIIMRNISTTITHEGSSMSIGNAPNTIVESIIRMMKKNI